MSKISQIQVHLLIIGCGVQCLLLIPIHICTLPPVCSSYIDTGMIRVCTWSIILSEIKFTHISTWSSDIVSYITSAVQTLFLITYLFVLCLLSVVLAVLLISYLFVLCLLSAVQSLLQISHSLNEFGLKMENMCLAVAKG